MLSMMGNMAPLEGMRSIARSLVSKKKRRFREHGFDLDLSYITPRIIAMGFPSEGAEGIYRNAVSEVYDFLTTFHDNRFKVFNLCAERTYDPAKLGGNVEWMPFSDHNPAPMEIMFCFCERAYDWLVADSNNVIVVHCKAGKGRTGLMICAYLLYSRECSDPVTAMQFYGERRTKNGKGLTIPSQRRYLFYFYELWKHGPRNIVPLAITKITLYSNVSLACDIQISISCNGGNGSYKLNPILETQHTGSLKDLIQDGKNTTFCFSKVRISGDVKIAMYDTSSSKKPIFYFWFNTAFVDGKVFSLTSKAQLDKPAKSVQADTQVHVVFSSRPPQKSRVGNDVVVGAELQTIEQLTKRLSSTSTISSIVNSLRGS